MFSEILRIKPVLDPAKANQMEQSLSARFKRVAKGFGAGIKAVMKGALLGIGIGLLARLLNPLEAVEQKIKDLLDKGDNLRDLADDFDTTPGKMVALQSVGAQMGLKPDQLKEMMGKFVSAIEKARDELRDPSVKTLSDSTVAVKAFAGDKDMADAFFQFTQSLRQIGLSSANQRRDIENAVFGGPLHGGEKRLIDSQYGKNAPSAGLPSQAKINQSADKLAALSDTLESLNLVNQTKDMVAGSGLLGESIIKDIAARQARDEAKVTEEIQSYKDLAAAKAGVDAIVQILMDLRNPILQLIAQLAKILPEIAQLRNSKVWKYLFRFQKE